MGTGIAIMHYVGMSALRANCLVGYSPPLVAASFAIAVAASGFALWLAFSPTHRPHVMAGAACMGLAISGMHYTGMAAATRSEEHTSELQSLMRISYAVFCLKKKKTLNTY